MPRETVKRRREESKGLHLTMKRGQYIQIQHQGETLVLHFHGDNGTDAYQVSAVGPKSFQIDHSRLLQPNPESTR